VTGASSSFYVTGGTLRHDAPSYVERKADRDLLEGLRAGEFCYVLTARQMGKSSLMVRTAAKLRESGTHVIVLDLTAIGQNVTPEQWYDGLLVRIGRQLHLEEEIEDYWQEHLRLSPVQRLFATIRDVALVRRPGPHVVFIDEIDMIRSLPFSTDEFFAAIRECYNRRDHDVEMGRLTFCLLGVATPTGLVYDGRITPFNIGRRIELHDFLPSEATTLAAGLSSPAIATMPAQKVLARTLFWTNGHPFLTQRLCLAAAQANGNSDNPLQRSADVDALCDELFFGERARERDDNLLFVRGRLLRADVERAGLLHLYDEVLRGRCVRYDERDPLVSVLLFAGIVRLEEGRLVSRNRIYERVFDRHWVRAQMPYAELERQKAAFNHGVIRTAAIAAVVLSALTLLVITGVREVAKARRAMAKSAFNEAQARRVTGIAGQRFESLTALRAARQSYTDLAALRDEAIACLALVDLKDLTIGLSALRRTNAFDLSQDIGVAAMAAQDGTIQLCAWQDGKLLKTLPGLNWPVEFLRFGASREVMVASYKGPSTSPLVVWNWDTEEKLFEAAQAGSAEAIDFSVKGRRLAVGSPNGRVRIYSLPRGELLNDLEPQRDSGQRGAPQTVRFSPSGEWLATWGQGDQFVEIWSLAVTQRLARLLHTDVVNGLSWHPQGHLLATACKDSHVYMWQTNDFDNPRSIPTRLHGHEGSVMDVAFNHRGTMLATLGGDETLRLWILGTGRHVAKGITGETFDQLRFSLDDRRLAAMGRQSNARVWEIAGDELMVLPVETGAGDVLRTIDFSPNGQWLLAATGSQATFWETDSGRELGSIPLPNPEAVWFSADGQRLLTSGEDGFIQRELRMDQDTSIVAGSMGRVPLSLDRKSADLMSIYGALLPQLDMPSATILRACHFNSNFQYFALHPASKWLATWTSACSNALQLWKLSEGAEAPRSCTIPSSEYFDFSPDGSWLGTFQAGQFRFYHVGTWDKPAFVIQRKLASDEHAPMSFTRDGRTVALASSRYTIQLFRLPDGGRREPVLIATLESPYRLPLQRLAFSPDGRRLAAASDRSVVQLWNLALLRDGLADLHLHQNWPEYR